ncbi:hypothetical protein MAFF211491_47320 (plasmid) [Ralstonia solanacearum]|nr:hypothetical protein MAFF211491_47320 [Ralstonia solanacearum]
MQTFLAIPPDMEEAGAARAAEPLVTVARVIRGANRPHIEGKHPWGMGSVDECVDASDRKLFDQRRDRENQPGWAGDVVEDGQPRAWSGMLEHCIDHHVRVCHGRRYGCDHYSRSRLARHEIEQIRARKVGVVCREDLIPREERTRTEYRAQRRRDIGKQDQILRVGRYQRGQRLSRLVYQTREITKDEHGGLTLEAHA